MLTAPASSWKNPQIGRMVQSDVTHMVALHSMLPQRSTCPPSQHCDLASSRQCCCSPYGLLRCAPLTFLCQHVQVLSNLMSQHALMQAPNLGRQPEDNNSNSTGAKVITGECGTACWQQLIATCHSTSQHDRNVQTGMLSTCPTIKEKCHL